MKGQLNPMIALMVAIIVGVVIAVPVVVDLVTLSTEAQTVTNAQVTGTNATTDTLTTYPDDVTGLTCYNATGGSVQITSGNYTLTSASPSTIEWTTLNNTLYPSPQFCNYTGYDPSYQDSSTTRTLTGLMPLLIVVAIVLFVVGFMKLS